MCVFINFIVKNPPHEQPNDKPTNNNNNNKKTDYDYL